MASIWSKKRGRPEATSFPEKKGCASRSLVPRRAGVHIIRHKKGPLADVPARPRLFHARCKSGRLAPLPYRVCGGSPIGLGSLTTSEPEGAVTGRRSGIAPGVVTVSRSRIPVLDGFVGDGVVGLTRGWVVGLTRGTD